jgi:hypothetical protein
MYNSRSNYVSTQRMSYLCDTIWHMFVVMTSNLVKIRLITIQGLSSYTSLGNVEYFHSETSSFLKNCRRKTYHIKIILKKLSLLCRPKMVVLGSREQMCIHKDVRSMRGRAQNHACRHLVKDRNCHHHNKVPGM